MRATVILEAFRQELLPEVSCYWRFVEGLHWLLPELQFNKHTESIAKAIQVPHRPQQIQICNHHSVALFNKEELQLLHPLSVFLFYYLMLLMKK